MKRFAVVLCCLMAAGIQGQKENVTDSRYGLIAPTIGVPPVPGASYGGNPGPGIIEGGHGGPPPPPPVKPITTCQCVPAGYCQAGPKPPPVPPPPGPGYGGGNPPPPPVQPPVGPGYGGNPPPPPPPPPGPGYGGGNPPPPPVQPPVGPGYGGGNPPPPPPPDTGYGPEPPAPVPGGPGAPGYGADGNGFDGTGLIDVRIVNRPPGNIACGAGEVYCCPQSYVPEPGHDGGCGTREFIDAGRPVEYGHAKFGAYPWMAVMLGQKNNYIGAGVLLTSHHVLTAAHKVADHVNGGFKVRFGEWNAGEDDEPLKHVEIPAARVEIHPAFNRQNLQNDVAIVTLAQPISLKDFPHIRHACLPPFESYYTGNRCWVAGFGKDAFEGGKHSYIMKEVDVPVVDSNECEQRLRKTRLGAYFNLNRKSFLCAGGEDGKDACTGDGGSPLVCHVNGRWTVAGLVAWGIGCAEGGIPGVYVNVPNYVNWIEGYISRDAPDDLAGYARVKPKETKP